VGFFDKLRESLTRTKEQIVSRFEEIVQQADTEEQRSRPIDVDTIEALEELLISADVGLAATERIVNAVRVRRQRASRSSGVTVTSSRNPAISASCRTGAGTAKPSPPVTALIASWT